MKKNGLNAKFAGYIALGKLIATALNFAIPLFLTRFLSKPEYGLYSGYFTITLFLSTIFSMGFYSSLYFFYPTAGENDRNKYIGNVFLSLLVLGVVGCIFTLLPLTKEALIGESELLNYASIIAISVLLTVPSTMLSSMYVVRLDKINTVLYPPMEIIIKVIVIILCIVLGGTLHSILWGLIVFQLLIFIYTLANVLINHKGQFIFAADKHLFRKQLKYAIPFGLTIILNAFSQRFDKILCISYLSSSDYAIYSVAFFGIPGIQQIYDSLSQVNVMQMTTEFQNGNKAGIIKNYHNFISKTLSFSTPVILIVFLYAEEIISFLFTSSYVSATIFFRIYILSFIVGMLGAGTILRATGKTKLSFRAYLISVIFTIPVTFFLIKNYGAYGAITAAMLGIILPKIIQSIFEIRLLSIPVKDYFPWKSILTIIVTSCLGLIPFVVIHQKYCFNIYICVLFSLLYLLGCYSIMIKKNVFIVNKDYVVLKLNKIFSI